MALKLFGLALGGLAVLALGADSGPTLNLKPGLWEYKTTVQMSGNLVGMTPEQIAKLPADQRAKMEAGLKQALAPKTSTKTTCLTPDQLTKMFDTADRPGCKRTVVTSTRKTQESTASCEQAGMRTTGKLKVEAPDPEHVRGSGETNGSGEGRSMTMKTWFEGKWLGSDCGKAGAAAAGKK